MPLAFAAVTSACGSLMVDDDQLHRAILRAAPGEGMGIVDEVGIEADRLCVVGPYTGREAFADVTGVDWPDIEHTNIASMDGIDLVAVIDNNEVVAWAEVDRGIAPDVVGVRDGCIP